MIPRAHSPPFPQLLSNRTARSRDAWGSGHLRAIDAGRAASGDYIVTVTWTETGA